MFEDLDKKLVFSFARRKIPQLRQLKFLPKLLDPLERWILRASGGTLILVLTFVVASYLKGHLVLKPQEGGSYREALVGNPRLINPILATTDVDRDLSRLLFPGLLTYNEKGELIPRLAEDYKVEEQGLAIRFKLKDGLRWQDGKTLEAQDVRFTLEAIKNPAWRSPLWRSFQDVSVEVVDTQTVRVKSSALLASFPHLFTVGILPAHIWEPIDPAAARLAVWNIKPVGSGPYAFKSLTKSQDGTIKTLRLQRAATSSADKPYIQEVSFYFFADFDSALEALRTHTVEGMSFVPERFRSKLPAAGIQWQRPAFPRFTGLFFQDRKNSVLRERAVRQALAVALDRQALAALVPDAEPVSTPFLEYQVGYALTIPLPVADPAKAAKILEGAGWKRGEQGWSKERTRLKLKLTVLDEPIYLTVADAVKQAWQALGVEVTLEAVSRGAFEPEVLRPRDFEVLLFSLVSGADPDPYPFWHSSQRDDPGVALSSVQSRPMDAALEQGRSTLQTRRRFESYLEFQTLLQEEVPGIILYASPYLYAVSKNVRGITLEQMATPADRFNSIAQWFVRSRPGWK